MADLDLTSDKITVIRNVLEKLWMVNPERSVEAWLKMFNKHLAFNEQKRLKKREVDRWGKDYV